ncbi:MAG: peptidoglycan D,D-transpeptidase FtsI family protein [Gaiellaceae bacterium]
MNNQLRRLAVLSCVLLGSLVVATTYWQSWAAGGLQARQDNAIQRVVQFTIARGLILASDDRTTFAANKQKKLNGQTLFFRRYPQHGLAAQTIGYSTESRSQAGLEESMNDYLTGANTSLTNAFRTELARLGGATVHGDNLILSLRKRAQEVAQQQLGDRCGAVVAMSPRTGAVYVMASSPTYDPNLIDQPNGYAKVLLIRGACGGASALLNRGTQGLFTPGSTFKMVTAAAALDSGRFTPSSTFNDPGYCVDYGKKVSNALNPDQNGPERYGHVTLALGFQHSINSVFCHVGQAIGTATIIEYMKRFGFYKVPPLELPSGELAASGLYNGVRPKLFDPKDPNAVDVGRLAFGQERLLVTPLQMAMVASAIANGGQVPKPYLVQKIVAPGGSVVRQASPRSLGRAISQQTASELTAMMVSVVQGGTGTKAQIPGIQVAGKTGTAETGVRNVYTSWFVCFAPADNPQVAVAVVLEKQAGGFGGTVAAPIAKAVLESLLHG